MSLCSDCSELLLTEAPGPARPHRQFTFLVGVFGLPGPADTVLTHSTLHAFAKKY